MLKSLAVPKPFLHRFWKQVFILFWVAVCAAVLPAVVRAQTAPANGMIVRADVGSTRVFFIEDNQKRWIVSGEAFRRQGFSWASLTAVPAADLAALPEGAQVTETSKVLLPGEAQVLPELIPLAPGDIHLSTLDGRTVLRFSATFWNKGGGSLELISQTKAGQSDPGYLDTFQRIVRPGGVERSVLVGNFLWHGLHNHYHYSDFADYVFELVRPAPGTILPVPPAITQKTTFCMRDNVLISPTLPGASRTKTFVYCGKYHQGVSVGWADVYAASLPDQYVDVQDLPAGVYRLGFNVDPRHHFLEVDQANNNSSALVELGVKNGVAKVIASASAFATASNFFPDGMLVRAEGRDQVYVIRHNKKRWLRSETVAASYGLTFSNAYEFPQSVIDAIPQDAFIRLSGSGRIFTVNATGYKRRILNPTALASYGAAATDIADVSAAEFDSSPETDLIALVGDERVYSTLTKRFVGTRQALPGLGRDPAAVHTVTRTDFDAYVVQVIAKDLNIPWDIVFLPDGDMLVTERSGTMRRFGSHAATISLPSVLHSGEGGLMGMALHPNFASNRYLYVYFTTTEKRNRISRFTLEGDALTNEQIILDGIPSALYHDGGQLAFGPDGMLYVTTGDAETPALAQDLGSLAGKTLRLKPDGGVPSDNPFGTAVWSYGHRNAQGIAWDSQGRMWQTEHGRSGALSGLDELNVVGKGKNYGWPTIQGDETAAGLVTPALHSGPNVTWAPSGLAYVDGKLFFAGLRGSALYEARPTEAGGILDFRARLSGVYGRLRAVVVGPDGFLYITTSNRDGRGTVRPGDDVILRVHQDLLTATP